jgi:hypothetical protein
MYDKLPQFRDEFRSIQFVVRVAFAVHPVRSDDVGLLNLQKNLDQNLVCQK